MNRLLSATAITLAMAGSAFAEAHSGMFPNVMVQHGQSYLASTLMGTRIYAVEQEYENGFVLPAGSAAEWDDIGEIGDVVISVDGKLQAVIIDVGGFLGIGEREVAVSWDAIRPVTEDDDPTDVFLTIAASEETLNTAPEFERMSAMEMEMETEVEADTMASDTEVVVVTDEPMMDGERAMLRRPMFEYEGYEVASMDQLTSEDLTGMNLYGAENEDIGEVSELIMSADGTSVEAAILDIGGFLGLGEHQVRVTMDEIQILRGEGGDYRAYIDATQEELEAQPEYDGM